MYVWGVHSTYSCSGVPFRGCVLCGCRCRLCKDEQSVGDGVPATHSDNTHNAVMIDRFRNARALTGVLCLHIHVQRVEKVHDGDCMRVMLRPVQEACKACRACLPRMQDRARALHSVTVPTHAQVDIMCARYRMRIITQ